jgi:putative flippase GtrA
LQIRRFAASGAVNTVTDYLVFMLLTKIFSVPLERIWVAKLISGGLAMAVSFLLNWGWVFASQYARRSGQVGRFLVTTISASWGIQLGLTQFFSTIWPTPGLAAFTALRRLGLPAMAPGIVTRPAAIKTVAFGLATMASMTWNFVLYRTWVFRTARP